MKPDTVTIPVTLTFDPAGQELAELARHIVTRLTDEGALDEAAEHGHGIMATSAAIEWASERLGHPIPAVPEPAPNAGASALYGPGETLEQLARSGELERAAGLEFAEELADTTDLRPAPPSLPRQPPGMSTPLARVAAAHGVTIHATDVAPLLRDRVYAMALAIDSDVFAEPPALRMTRFLASAEHLALIDPPTVAQPNTDAAEWTTVDIGATGVPHRAAITPEGDVYAGITYPKEQ